MKIRKAYRILDHFADTGECPDNVRQAIQQIFIVAGAYSEWHSLHMIDCYLTGRDFLGPEDIVVLRQTLSQHKAPVFDIDPA